MERRDDRRDVPDRRDWADRKDEVVRRDDRLLPTREERYSRFSVLILREHFTSIKHRERGQQSKTYLSLVLCQFGYIMFCLWQQEHVYFDFIILYTAELQYVEVVGTQKNTST